MNKDKKLPQTEKKISRENEKENHNNETNTKNTAKEKCNKAFCKWTYDNNTQNISKRKLL